MISRGPSEQNDPDIQSDLPVGITGSAPTVDPGATGYEAGRGRGIGQLNRMLASSGGSEACTVPDANQVRRASTSVSLTAAK